MENKILGMLGLARRAGKVTLGFENVQKLKKCCLVLIAADAAERTVRHTKELGLETICLDSTKNVLGKALGAGQVSVLGVTDPGFADAIRKLSEY